MTNKIKTKWISIGGAIFVTIALIIRFSDRKGFTECLTSLSLKRCSFLGLSIFEWIQTFSTPILITLGGYFANRFFKNLERERERQESLKNYFDQMTNLLLKVDWNEQINLIESEGEFVNRKWQGGEVKKIFAIARARTLAILEELDSKRRSDVLLFLIESKMIPYMRLKSANLAGVSLCAAQLRKVDLENANLEGANLEKTNLKESNLKGANLKNTNFTEADLTGAILFNANLEGTILLRADLKGALFSRIDQLGDKLRSFKCPYICNTRLPDRISSEEIVPINVNWCRDCKKLPYALVRKGYILSFKEAQKLVEDLHSRTWLD